MSGSDPSPLQIIAHASISAANPPVTAPGAGQDSQLNGLSLAFTNPGVYLFTLDAGLPGDGTGVVALALRILATLRTGTGAIQAVKTGVTQITVNTFAADGSTATNKAFDLIVFRVPGQ